MSLFSPFSVMAESAVFQTYYQWTPIIFLIQACAFYISYLVWAQLENGTMKNLRLSLNDASLNSKDREKNIRRLVEYFNDNIGRHSLYGKHYIYCLVFNIINVMLQVMVTNFLLDGRFLSYGYTFSYSRRIKDSGNSPEINDTPHVEDIMFPKTAKCSLYLYGPSGSMQNFDGICVLPINLLHDKIFIVLWYWYLVLFTLSAASLIYWACHYFQPAYRMKHIEAHLKGISSYKIKHKISSNSQAARA